MNETKFGVLATPEKFNQVDGQQTIAVPADDLYTLLSSTVRYSLGRMSYMPEYARQMVKAYGGMLMEHQLLRMAEEIDEYLGRVPGDYDRDIIAWAQFAGWCREEAAKRKEKS